MSPGKADAGRSWSSIKLCHKILGACYIQVDLGNGNNGDNDWHTTRAYRVNDMTKMVCVLDDNKGR